MTSAYFYSIYLLTGSILNILLFLAGKAIVAKNGKIDWTGHFLVTVLFGVHGGDYFFVLCDERFKNKNMHIWGIVKLITFGGCGLLHTNDVLTLLTIDDGV